MVIDFSSLDLKERPMLVLCTPMGVPFQPLGMAYNVHATLHYNEVSELTFDLPAYVDGKATPNYDNVKGMNYILWPDMGYFVLNNPETTSDGVEAVKSCTAYSAEYEFSFKQFYIEAGTFCFYDTLDNSNTMMGRIMELMPNWSIGSVSEDLWDRYRTFDETTANVYDFIKGTIQDSYACIFDFDCLNRKVYVRSTEDACTVQPVYLSQRNLAKEITVKENTDNLYTCLDVNGAEDVNIRSVNPLGTNKIYDLSYFMTEDNVGAELAAKWAAWQKQLEDVQLSYFNTTVEESLQQARLDTANATLTTLQGELSTLETLQSTYVEALASGEDSTISDSLAEVKTKITAKNTEISAQETEITKATAAVAALHAELEQVNADVAMSNNFTVNELLTINQYIKEDTIQDTTFVAPTASVYTTSDTAGAIQSGAITTISGGTQSYIQNSSGKDIYSYTGGTLTAEVDGVTLSAKMIRGAVECSTDGAVVLTAYLNTGSYGSATTFTSGCVSITGTGRLSASGDDVKATVTDGFFFLTENTTEYQQRSIEWDLLEYGQETLQHLAYPAYSFEVDCGNFFCMDDFTAFRRELTMGQKLYLDLDDGEVITPILIGCELDFEDLTDFTLEFGDTYSCLDAEFKLADLLDQSVSSGKSADYSKFTASAWVDSGASNSVEDFIKSALDASKNAVISGADQAIVFNQSGLRLRKSNGAGGYEDEQIWMINNNIVFTDNNWESAKMAIGKFHDDNTGDVWGIVAPSIVGTILAGKSLVIESSKKDGGVAVFRVDSDGAKLYNSRFDLVNEYGTNSTGQISLVSPIGLVAGNVTTAKPMLVEDSNKSLAVRTVGGNLMYNLNTLDQTDLPNASFWIDMYGNAYFKGTVYATDGEFSGTLKAADGEFTGTLNGVSGDFSGTLKAAKLEGTLDGTNGGAIKGVSLGIGGTNYDNFVVDSNGNVTMKGSINLSSGSITWGSNDPKTTISYLYSAYASGSESHSDMRSTDKYRCDVIDGVEGSWYQFRGTDGENGEPGSNADVPDYIKSTYIDFSQVKTPMLIANYVKTLGTFQVGTGSAKNFTATGYMGYAKGKNSDNEVTYGVALSYEGDDLITYKTQGHYLIVTSDGVRMQAPGHSIVVTQYGCFYDDTPIGSGGSGSTAVWG